MDAGSTRARSRWTATTLGALLVAGALLAGSGPSFGAERERRDGAIAPRMAETAARAHALATLEARAKADAAARWLASVQYAAAVDAAQREQAAREQAARDAVWDRMANCETGGNWSMRGSRYSGGVGFANSTWHAYGGWEFAANAGLATREQQIVVANRVRDAVGYRAWGCARAAGVG